jgi:hypothetical protein
MNRGERGAGVTSLRDQTILIILFVWVVVFWLPKDFSQKESFLGYPRR